MIPKILAVTVTLLPLCCFGQALKKPPPKFEDFPVTQKWNGVHSEVRLETTEQRLFRTNLREASKKAPNFAARYRIIIWGCGTQCIQGGMVDIETGKIAPLPTGGKSRGERFWDICDSAFYPSGIEHRVDSKLLIIRCADIVGPDGGNYMRTSYFVIENGSFQRIEERHGLRVF